MSSSVIETVAERILQALPSNVVALSEDVRYIARDIIKEQLLKLDLVPKQEFETQCAVLQRCQEKLQHLEKQLSELEDKFRDVNH